MRLSALRNAWVTLACATGLFGLVGRAAADDLPNVLDCRGIVQSVANKSLTNFAVSKDSKFLLTFVRDVAGKYAMVGNVGSAPLDAVVESDFVQLIERTPMGIVHVTTILSKPDKDGAYKAVHSRNSAGLGMIVPSQIIMSCRTR